MLGEFSRCKICYLIQLRLPYHFFFYRKITQLLLDKKNNEELDSIIFNMSLFFVIS